MNERLVNVFLAGSIDEPARPEKTPAELSAGDLESQNDGVRFLRDGGSPPN
jgi:hypothetical protein